MVVLCESPLLTHTEHDNILCLCFEFNRTKVGLFTSLVSVSSTFMFLSCYLVPILAVVLLYWEKALYFRVWILELGNYNVYASVYLYTKLVRVRSFCIFCYDVKLIWYSYICKWCFIFNSGNWFYVSSSLGDGITYIIV